MRPVRFRVTAGTRNTNLTVLLGVSLACAAGWAAQRLSIDMLPTLVAILAFGSAAGIAVWGFRSGLLVSPPVLIGVPLLVGLASAALPITQIHANWSPGSLGLVVATSLAPLAGCLASMVAGGRLRMSRAVRPASAAAPNPTRVVVVCVAFFTVGAAVLMGEFIRLGSAPLFSATIDRSRFDLVSSGPLFLLTDGLTLSMLIAAWARFGHGSSFSTRQRAVLNGVIVLVPITAAMQGGRIIVFLPLVIALVVAARYRSVRWLRRSAIVGVCAFLAFSSALFLTRTNQGNHYRIGDRLFFTANGQDRGLLSSALLGMSYTFGEQNRVVLEMREAKASFAPFSTSIWFAHRFVPRARNPEEVARGVTQFWITSGYAGPLLLDLGVVGALLGGFVLGAVAQRAYEPYARGGSVRSILMYAYLAGPIAMMFYVNLFAQYAYVWVDLAVVALIAPTLVRQAADRKLASPPALAHSRLKG